MKTSKIKEIKLLFLSALALLILVSLLTFDQEDIRFLTTTPNLAKNNIAGFIGAYLSWALLFLTGYGAYAIPLFIILSGIISLLETKPHNPYLRVFGALFSVVALSSVFSMIGVQDVTYRFARGGIIGVTFSDFLLKYLGIAGTFIVITVFFLLSLLISTDFLLFSFFGWAFKSLGKIRFNLPGIPRIKTVRKQSPEFEKGKAVTPPKIKIHDTAKQETDKKGPKISLPFKTKKKAQEPEPQREEAKSKTHPKTINAGGEYDMPSIELLESPPASGGELKENLEENSSILEETLEDFGIEAKVVEINRGPVITRYELEPASGVKIHKITSLSDNIALAMKAVSIRIVAPIPGKGTVGVEVPNSKSTLVYLRELLESKEYKESHSKLKLALGKDISGTPIIAELDDMPHLLIAGATGSGKTVCVNSIITALLYNATPDELKFIMVDPKRVELAAFNGLPHLLSPVVTDAKKVSQALNWCVNEMDKRYELFSQVGVRNIDGYNRHVKTGDLGLLPYIVIIIDELADLMLVAQQEVESTIARLAQLSRAVGIHMIIATQRPSVDVITGVIKANFPARISFKVASKVDSRTVIDMNGAEKLLGRGDMLFIEPGNPKPIRAQGCLVSDDSINKLTSFIKSQRTPEFEEEILKTEEKPTYKNFEKDEVYDEAVRLVVQTKQASVSMLQRRLGVGYTRAARLIDMMEDEKIVGPYQGSKPRDVLIESLEENSDSR